MPALALLALALGGASAAAAAPCPLNPDSNTCTDGPDVTVINLTDIANHGGSDGFRGFSVGTDSCNVGSEPLNWCDNPGGCTGLKPRQHPVIGGNLYRVKDGRLEQLGKSWLKHGFFSLNTTQAACGSNSNPANPPSCVGPPRGGNELGVGCTDIYGSGLNGSRPLGQRYEVNPSTGVFAFPETTLGASGAYEQRIRVKESDLEAAQNPGARYFLEAQYIADNDANATTDGISNAFNNASYREVSVDGSLNLSFVANTVRERSAIHAWKAVDPSVEVFNLDSINPQGIQERFEVGRKVTENGGVYTTVLAVRNMNSNRAANALTVRFVQRNTLGAGISNPTFHSVDNHSGEFAVAKPGEPVLENTPWDVDLSDPSRITWSTESYEENPAANALRWGTTFTFSFDSTIEPSSTEIEIGFYNLTLFEDGFETGDTDVWGASTP